MGGIPRLTAVELPVLPDLGLLAEVELPVMPEQLAEQALLDFPELPAETCWGGLVWGRRVCRGR